MGTLAHHFVTMAYNNAWANQRLLAACGQLSQEEFVAPRTSFFPSLKATLNHNLTVDWYYVDALERFVRSQPVNSEPMRFFEPEEPFATCHELHAAQRDVDRRLIEVCTALTEAQLESPVAIQRSKGVLHETVTRLLAHLFQHQIHHRGQAHAMLAGTAVPPPQLDEFYCANDASRRVEDFRVLGFSEAGIWQDDPARE